MAYAACFAVLGTTLSRSFLDRMSDKQFYYWTRRVILAHRRGLCWAGHLADGDAMVDVKAEVRALLDRLPDDCSYRRRAARHRRADVAQAAATAA